MFRAKEVLAKQEDINKEEKFLFLFVIDRRLKNIKTEEITMHVLEINTFLRILTLTFDDLKPYAEVFYEMCLEKLKPYYKDYEQEILDFADLPTETKINLIKLYAS